MDRLAMDYVLFAMGSKGSHRPADRRKEEAGPPAWAPAEVNAHMRGWHPPRPPPQGCPWRKQGFIRPARIRAARKKRGARRTWKPLFSSKDVIFPWRGRDGSSPRRTGCASPSARPPPPRAGCSRRQDHSAASDRPAGLWRRQGHTCPCTWG